MWSSSGSKGLDVTKERGGRVEKGVQKARQKAGQREPHDNYNPPPPPDNKLLESRLTFDFLLLNAIQWKPIFLIREIKP